MVLDSLHIHILKKWYKYIIYIYIFLKSDTSIRIIISIFEYVQVYKNNFFNKINVVFN